FSQFSRKCFKFLFVHNLPVSVVGVKISKTGNYTILFTVSKLFFNFSLYRNILLWLELRSCTDIARCLFSG
ncbi:hypothetical protein GC310_18945, partial [Yersinia pestis]|nr:hypothetical protein [Yersinia pestis]MBE7742490.1 hypothetical protein [Yersinia pestis]MBE7746616.1 hypothetical protein [Yersinia pestis]MBE7750663.1 hypothetical protein [Yersinia pestis]MBE7763046.1 hypothetical protein [Yersinia pestis]